jgi:hypothetical protein
MRRVRGLAEDVAARFCRRQFTRIVQFSAIYHKQPEQGNRRIEKNKKQQPLGPYVLYYHRGPRP